MADYVSADNQERTNLRRPDPATKAAPKEAAPAHPLVHMQRQLGNAQVARMLARRHGDDDIKAKHDIAQREDDEDEMDSQDEDENEESVQAMHDAQRVEEDDEESLQAKHDAGGAEEERIGLEGGPVSSGMAARIDGARGGGSSLDAGVKAQAEGAFGADLSNVRVHQNSESDSLNRSMTAKAFTTGSDIFLRSDANAADSSLMSHELTHVVQQSTGAVGSTGGMTVGAAGDAHEQEADQMAAAITSGAAQREREEQAAG